MDDQASVDLGIAIRIVRLHCPIEWPGELRCLNCNSNAWAWDVLTPADWTEEAILRLDSRTGPWS